MYCCLDILGLGSLKMEEDVESPVLILRSDLLPYLYALNFERLYFPFMEAPPKLNLCLSEI